MKQFYRFAVISLVILLVQAVSCMSLPDDEVMIETFQQNRQGFEELLRVACAAQVSQDGNVHVHKDDSPDVHSLMERLGVRNVFGTANRMVFECTGLEHEFSGIKGYLFMPPEYEVPPDSNIVRSLDGIVLSSPKKRYRSLGDGWFLYLQGPSD